VLSEPLNATEALDRLERLLVGQLDGYRRLLEVIARQREAIRTANGAALEQATRAEEPIVRVLAALDGQREQMLAHMRQRWMPHEGRTPALSRLLASAPAEVANDDDRRSRLLMLANHLRQAVETAKRAGSVVRSAAEALSRHVAGIQQTVHSALSRARVYERRGRLSLGAATPAAVDLKS
jgi:hypothetical protein